MKPLTWILPLCLALLPFNLTAQTSQEKGLAIAIEANKRDTGWGDMKTEAIMTLRNQHGQVSERKNRQKLLEVDGDGDKSLIIFDTPADIKGTAFLSHTHALKPDDQWLYLPSLKRIKRISSSNKSGPFLGSEFAYEDLSSQEVEKYSYNFIKDDTFNNRDTWVIERIPQYKKSGYKRQLVWMDKEYYQPVQIEFYDRKNALLKTLNFFEYKQYLNQYWRPNHMEMKNHQTKKSTVIAWSAYHFQTGLNKRHFDKNSLKRIR